MAKLKEMDPDVFIHHHKELINLVNTLVPYIHTKFEIARIIIARKHPLAKAMNNIKVISKGLEERASALRFDTPELKNKSLNPVQEHYTSHRRTASSSSESFTSS